MSSGGIAKRLINLAMLILGRVPGSLALTNVAANAMFGSLSGSGIAAATAVGGIMGPLEKEEGYDEKFSAACNIATAPVGQLIPPNKCIYRIFSSKWWSSSSYIIYGRMDSRIIMGIPLHDRSIHLW